MEQKTIRTAALAAAALPARSALCRRVLADAYGDAGGNALRTAALWRDLICSM